jgi:hypothetical protein
MATMIFGDLIKPEMKVSKKKKKKKKVDRKTEEE